MSRPKPAQRAAAAKVAPTLAALLSPARAEASRRNGAKSKGPKTAEGKARSSRNALTHGLCASHHVVVDGESAEAFAAFEAALMGDLAPAGALQTLLAGRIARAAWRLERAERIEAELFAREMDLPFGEADLGLALIRDGNGARAFDTLLRYRAAAQAEMTRTLRTLKALQAEAPPAREAAPEQPSTPRRACGCSETAPDQDVKEIAGKDQPPLPIEPKSCGNPCESNPGEPAQRPSASPAAAVHSHGADGGRSGRDLAGSEGEGGAGAGIAGPGEF